MTVNGVIQLTYPILYEIREMCCEMSEPEYNAYKTEILDGIEDSRLRERTRNVFSWIEEQMKE